LISLCENGGFTGLWSKRNGRFRILRILVVGS